MESPSFLTGQLLLAMPGIRDPRFEKSVIAMCSHDEAGALGITVHAHAPGVTLHKVLEQFDVSLDGLADGPVFLGGPVEPQRGFVLHSLDWGGQGTTDVAGKWGLTATIDALRAIGRPNGPSQWLLALGYAGWGAGQLDGEMKRSGWHVAPAKDELIFTLPLHERWESGWRATGIDPRLLSPEVGHA
jgi:putative transcriptional regulator